MVSQALKRAREPRLHRPPAHTQQGRGLGLRKPEEVSGGDYELIVLAKPPHPRRQAGPLLGDPSNPSNKVLWIVRFPRNGNPLTITARFATNPAHVVQIRRPADSEPGEIYPSDVNLPRAGCWELALDWGSHRASIDIQVQSPSRAAPRQPA